MLWFLRWPWARQCTRITAGIEIILFPLSCPYYTMWVWWGATAAATGTFLISNCSFKHSCSTVFTESVFTNWIHKQFIFCALVSLQDSDLLPQRGDAFSGEEAHLTLPQALPDASRQHGEESGGLQHPDTWGLCCAWLCCAAAQGVPAQGILRAQLPARELNLSQTQRSFETLPASKRIFSTKGSHHSCAQHQLGNIPDTFSTWYTHSDHCLCHKTDGPWSEKYSNDIPFIVLSWVNSVFWECRDQGKSSDSAVTLPVNPYGLADEVADMPDFIVFPYSFHVWFRLLVFGCFSFWAVLVLWLLGAFSSEREWEEQA